MSAWGGRLRRILLPTVVFAIRSVFAVAQETGAVHEAVSVRVMDIDVVVTDRDGRPVHNLLRDDFTIRVDRKRVEIDYFAAVREGAIRAHDTAMVSPDLVLQPEEREKEAAVPRHFLLFVDEASLAPAHRRKALEALKEFVARLGPSDEATVVAERELPVTLAPWTSSKESLLASIDAISRTSVGGLRRIERERQAMREIELTGLVDARESRARLYEEETYEETKKTLLDMSDTLALLGDKPGKKVFVNLSEGFELHPGAALLGFAASTAMAGQSFRRDVTPELRRFIDRANALETTVFTVDAGGLLAPGNDAANEPPLAATSLVAREDRQAALAEMAEETGGEAVLHANDVGAALAAVYRDVSSYYSLGVNLRNVSPNAAHRVEVLVSRPGLKVRARKTYMTITEEARLADRVRATLLTSSSYADLAPTLRAGVPVKEHGLFLLPVEIEVAARQLTFVSEGGADTARPVYYFAGVSDRGEQTPLSRTTQAFTLPAAETHSGKALIERVTLKLRKGIYRIVVNVLDPETSRMGTARTTVRLD